MSDHGSLLVGSSHQLVASMSPFELYPSSFILTIAIKHLQAALQPATLPFMLCKN